MPKGLLYFGTFCLALLLTRGTASAQSFEVVNGDTINRTDEKGRKHGLWKYWDNNLSLAMVCHYNNDNPAGKLIYYQKNRTILELEPLKGKKEIVWRYFGSGQLVQGKLRKGKKDFEFINVKGKKLKKSEIQIITSLMELDASYRGGFYELFQYFRNNIRYPESSEKDRKQGIVEIAFVVKENGEIGEVKLLSGFDKECNEAALECVRTMPRWRPATKMGYAFESTVKVPVEFKTF
jgi:TonB family protein